MTSRLTPFATAFAVLATASLGYAASLPQAGGHAATRDTTSAATSAAAEQVRVVQLERVVIIAKRLPQAAI